MEQRRRTSSFQLTSRLLVKRNDGGRRAFDRSVSVSEWTRRDGDGDAPREDTSIVPFNTLLAFNGLLQVVVFSQMDRVWIGKTKARDHYDGWFEYCHIFARVQGERVQ